MPSSLQEIMGFNFSAFPKIEVTKPIRPPFCKYSKVATLKNTFALATSSVNFCCNSCQPNPVSINSAARIA